MVEKPYLQQAEAWVGNEDTEKKNKSVFQDANMWRQWHEDVYRLRKT